MTEATYGMADKYIDTVAKVVGDTEDVFGWWFFDNDKGNGDKLFPREDGTKHSITTIEEVVDFIDKNDD